jgi:predicted ATPase with chaperone activity
MVNLGLPSFVIVEPTGRAIQEARERIIRASVRNAGFDFPQRVTVNLLGQCDQRPSR